MRLTFKGVILVAKLHLPASEHRLRLLRLLLVLAVMLVVDEAESRSWRARWWLTSCFRVVEDLENFVI
jgi:hypothetical protein